jgi:hypothetical protein
MSIAPSQRQRLLRLYQRARTTSIVALVCWLAGVASAEAPTRLAPVQPPACEGGTTGHTLGQSLYVPAYSSVYYQNQKRRYALAVTLSIRNTDGQHALTVTSVRYVGAEGQLLQEYVATPLPLGPLGSTEFFVDEQDRSGGIGASFLIEWHAEKPISAPVVETVMIGTTGTQAISFVSVGRILRNRTP